MRKKGAFDKKKHNCSYPQTDILSERKPNSLKATHIDLHHLHPLDYAPNPENFDAFAH